MRDLYLKRNELNARSQKLRTAKFKENISREKIKELIEQQEEIYKRYKFYDNYIKIGGRIHEQQIHTKERWLLFIWYWI